MTGIVELTRERRITADPTSLALLLAGPTGVDLWPGTRRRGETRGLLLVDADLTPADVSAPPARLIVRADAPRRTPAAFVLRFDWEPDGVAVDGSGAMGGSGTLALGYEGAHETRAALRITLTGDADTERASLVDDMAVGFLDNLAAAAEARSRAA